MDLFLIIVLFIVFCVLFSICGWCCKKHREGTVHGFATTTVHQVTVPPYPMDTSRQPLPQLQPAPGFLVGGYQTSAYPVPMGASYPPHQGGYPPAPSAYPGGNGAPYPSTNPPYPVATAAAPYPPATGGAPYPTPAGTQQLPPSYTEAVNQPHADAYSKQAPYNPHY